jgi:signal transduction histidine kinase
VDAREGLQDSGLRDSRLLARLFQSAVVVLDDAQQCLFASSGACELFGAASCAALRAQWSGVRDQLGLSALDSHGEDDPPLQRRVDVTTASGIRRLRFEAHLLAPGASARHVLLVRDRMRVGDADRALLLASEAHAGRHVLTGLVHEAKGPLNNFYLTLSLLKGGLSRVDASPLPERVRAQWSRYVDVLQKEAARLVDCLDDLQTLTRPDGAPGERVELTALSRDVLRVLRHEATMHETAIEPDLPSSPVWIDGNAHQLRLALLAFTSAIVEAARPGASVRFHVAAIDDGAGSCVSIDTLAPRLPASLAAELYRLGCAGESDHIAAIAGRIVVEAHGGDVTLDAPHDARGGFTIRMPASSR